MPVHDTLVGQVLHEAKPVVINQQSPTKIKTSFLVRSLMYVPLLLDGKAIGILEVDNIQSNQAFSDYDITLATALADYAAVAIKNANYYSESEINRHKWEAILTNVKDGVIVVDQDLHVILMNHAARLAFSLADQDPAGKSALEVIQNPDLHAILSDESNLARKGFEINLPDGKVLNTQVTAIPGIGIAVTMQDITHLKKLDRIKSDFVSTVSHDLRSPLTAILGYTELVGRVGPLNERQKEFVERVQGSVQNITALVNDLLDLGRIEAGFDERKENVSLPVIIGHTLNELESAVAAKSQVLKVELADLPPVIGNPTRLRQMVANLVINAINYTPTGSQINVTASAKTGQAILQVSDNGPGIPPAELPHIFDKFFRGSNLPEEAVGTGLGLAIVKSIVDDHHGLVWVDSTLGKGSTFTIVLPFAPPSG